MRSFFSTTPLFFSSYRLFCYTFPNTVDAFEYIWAPQEQCSSCHRFIIQEHTSTWQSLFMIPSPRGSGEQVITDNLKKNLFEEIEKIISPKS